VVDQDPLIVLGVEDFVGQHHQHLVVNLGDVGVTSPVHACSPKSATTEHHSPTPER
jgi:hypothetical protein